MLSPEPNETLKNIFIVDIKCGTDHNMAKSINSKTSKTEYYLWGNNCKNQCTLSATNTRNVRLVTIPLLFDYTEILEDYEEIISLILGNDRTFILIC